jgi:trk system potassium uptake protein TrkH
MVQGKTPILQQVSVTPNGTLPTGVSGEAVEQTHTFIQDVQYKGEKFIDTLFTSVSALCVTGLISTDFSQWTFAGQFVTMILIQMGGLGIIVFTTIFAMYIVRGISEHESFKSLLAGIMDTDPHRVRHMIKHVILYTALFEGLGFLIMGIHLHNADPTLLGGHNPWWWALFHSVSAFNNAGFSLNNNNLMFFAKDPIISLVIAGQIIIGGLGYPVLIAIHARARRFLASNDKTQKALEEDVAGVVASPLQTRVALVGTILLLSVGTFLPLIIDWGNPIYNDMTFAQRLLANFFQSTSTRTAGFNTVDIGALSTATLFLFMGLMFIGANPAGTAGGIKIPTMATLYGYIKDWFKAPGQPISLFSRKISKFALSHAMRLFFFSTLFIAVITMIMTIAEQPFLATPDPTFNFTKILFEVFSAFGTVGLSMGFPGGVTSFSGILTTLSKSLLITTMLFGRLGPLTILAALPWKRRHMNAPLSPDFDNVEKLQIG